GGAVVLAVALAGVFAGRAGSAALAPRSSTLAEAYSAGIVSARELQEEWGCAPSRTNGIICVPTAAPWCPEESPAAQAFVGRLQEAVWAARGRQPECAVSAYDIELMPDIHIVGLGG